MEQTRQLEILINSFQEHFAGFKGEMMTSMINIKEDVAELKNDIKHVEDTANKVYAIVNNGLKEKTQRVDEEIQRKAGKEELNDAMRSMRRENNILKGIFGVGLTAIVTLIVLL
jgi:hypothetical protein